MLSASVQFTAKYHISSTSWKTPFNNLLNGFSSTSNSSVLTKLRSLKLTLNHSDNLKNIYLMPIEIHVMVEHLGGISLTKSLKNLAFKYSDGQVNSQAYNDILTSLKNRYYNTYSINL